MKKLTFFAILACIGICWAMTSCQDESDATQLWIVLDSASPTKEQNTVYGGSKAVYDINTTSKAGFITSFKIFSTDPINGRVERFAYEPETPNKKLYECEYTHDVPIFTNEPEEVIITLKATDQQGNTFTKTCRLKVMNTKPEEPGGEKEGGE